MTRYLVLAVVLAACSGKSDRVDSVDAAMPAIDTLKPVTASDTAATAPTPATRTQPPTRLGRDSAFPPPANLPRLDTVKKKPPA